jgi:hypothetical protein
MQTVVETETFADWYQRVWSDEERDAFVDWIAANPKAGRVIPGAAPVRKVRWARDGMGKRGGARVIYFLGRPHGEVVLLLAYAKSKFDNLRPEFLLKLKETCDA